MLSWFLRPLTASPLVVASVLSRASPPDAAMVYEAGLQQSKRSARSLKNANRLLLFLGSWSGQEATFIGPLGPHFCSKAKIAKEAMTYIEICVL